MAQQPDQRIVGHDLVEDVGLVPRQDLQNISGENWAAHYGFMFMSHTVI